MNYRREIDGLRAIAVLSVIFFHAGFEIFSGGFVGVDIFFVISGYLITTIILKELKEDQFSIVNFYERRARRILPALFFLMFICLPFAWYILVVPADMKNFSQSLIAVSTFISNIFFWSGSGYFDNTSELKPLLHTWSLSVEEQYYIFFPLLLSLMWSRKKQKAFYYVFIFFFLGIILMQIMIQSAPKFTFFMLPTRSWELLFGAISAFYLLFYNHHLKEKYQQLLSIFGGVLIVYAVFSFDKYTLFPSLYAVIPTLGTVLIIIYATNSNYIGKFLGGNILVGIGLVSYSAYLWHQPLFAFSKIWSVSNLSNLVSISLILITFVIAYVSWSYIEKPFRDRKKISRLNIFYLSVSGLLFFIAVGVIGVLTNGFELRSVSRQFMAFDYDMGKLGYEKCKDSALISAGLTFCLKQPNKITNAVILGDSHAEDKFYGVSNNVPWKNWAIIGNSSCPPVLGISVEGDQKGCLDKSQAAIQWIINNKTIDTVILSFYGNYALTTAYAADHLKNMFGPDTIKITSNEIQSQNKQELFYYGLAKATKNLLDANKNVIFFIDVPELPFFPIDCVKDQSSCQIPLIDVLNRQNLYRQLMVKLKQDFPKIKIFDPLAMFCRDDICTYKRDDSILYRDSHHLTLMGSDYYGSQFTKWLKNNE